ncbi:restriction endonuclease subunit S [Algibacter lectus]|uniref:Type I restriction enzyme S subunit n=1 Tax=Algibacter lectus TaxID=221126 RepID=A0A4R8ME90_9FLAO|nr:restriction endonuclease subunit S [Algibacter lectus]MWW23143.1 hypothetical protein [Algibacter lectus]TDY64179.1 type I restriction enzyme S subunit [Algibacter lectus]
MEKTLPKNWVNAKLKDLSTIQSGGTPSRSKKQYWSGDIPWVKISDLKEWYVNSTTEFITEEGLNNSSTKIFPKGTILFTIFATIGKVGVLDIEACTNQAIAGITPVESIEHKFLTYSLIELAEILKNEGKGVAQKNINLTILKDLNIPLPPLAEQQRIVAKLDALFGHLEQIKNRLDSLNKIGGKYLNSCIVNSSENKFYPRKKIGEFLEEGTSRIGNDWEGLRLIGVSAKEGITDLRIGQKKSFEKYKIVQPGDFIYNTMRVNIGSIAIYEGDKIALTSPDYVVFRVKEYLSAQLLFRFLKSEQGLLEIGSNTKGSVRARLYFSALSEIRMPIAPEPIQLSAQKFLKEFDTTLKSLNSLKRKQLDKLPQAILAKAFKGELVEQLDADGSAEVLLEEIESLKAELKPVKKTVKRKKK